MNEERYKCIIQMRNGFRSKVFGAWTLGSFSDGAHQSKAG